MLIFSVSLFAQKTVIINHTNCDPSELSDDQLDTVRNLKAMFGHKSVGLNIVEGLEALAGSDPDRYDINIVSPFRWANVVGAENPAFGEWSNGQNYEPETKIAGFDNMIRGGDGTGEWGNILHIAFFKYCFLDVDLGTDLEGLYNTYMTTMTALINEYPACKFVHFTVPLTGTNLDQNVAKHHYNQMIREYVNTKGGYLFDLAEIEAYDENDVYQSFEYEGSSYPMMWYDAQDSQNNGWSYDGGHLNEKGKNHLAKAMWSLLSAMSGEVAAAIDEEEKIFITSYRLSQNFPNPFNPVTIISYTIPKSSLVKIEIFNILGKSVSVLVNAYQKKGEYSINFIAGSLPSGIYFYQMTAGDYSEVKKMMLVK